MYHSLSASVVRAALQRVVKPHSIHVAVIVIVDNQNVTDEAEMTM